MTTTTPPSPTTETVTVIIDGKTLQVPKGTMLIEACNQNGADVPFFCYHPGLSSPAVCRQCLVDVKGQPKPVPSCYTPVADKMEVATASPIVLDQERCILCTRCIRVCDEVAGVHQLEMSKRGDRELLGTAPGHKLDNPY